MAGKMPTLQDLQYIKSVPHLLAKRCQLRFLH